MKYIDGYGLVDSKTYTNDIAYFVVKQGDTIIAAPVLSYSIDRYVSPFEAMKCRLDAELSQHDYSVIHTGKFGAITDEEFETLFKE